MNAHVIVFDLDDTLTSEREYCLSGFRAVGAHLSEHYQIEGFGDLACSLFLEGCRGTVFNEALAQLGRSDFVDRVPELVDVYRNHTPAISLFEDAREVLTHLRAAKVPMAIITDGYLRAQQQKVAALGLRQWVDFVLCTDELGREHWKPSPVPYQRVMDQFARTNASFVYVGDNPKKDFITARKLGWQTCQIQRAGAEYAHQPPSPEHAADFVIDDLRQLMSPWVADRLRASKNVTHAEGE